MIREIRSLLYEQGYTIGGARLQLSDSQTKDTTKCDSNTIQQLRMEMEEVLKILTV